MTDSSRSDISMKPAAKKHEFITGLSLVVRWDLDSTYALIHDVPKSCVGRGTSTLATEKKIKLLRMENKQIEPATVLGYSVFSEREAMDMAASTLHRLKPNTFDGVEFNVEPEFFEMDEVEYVNLWADMEETIRQQSKMKRKPENQKPSTAGKWLRNQ